MNGIQLLFAVIFVIKYDNVDSFNHFDSMKVINTVANIWKNVPKSEMRMVTDALPSKSSSHLSTLNSISTRSIVKGKFSNNKANTFRCCSIDYN